MSVALSQENRWEARPRTAAALKLAIYAIPFITSAVAARASQTVLRNAYPDMHWSVAAVLSIPFAAIVLVVVGRAMRRLLPLALLLKLSLLFPDQIPGRLGISLRAASTKRLARRMSEEEGEGATAAENILALVAALGAHDRRTRGHSERVRALTMLMADEVGLKPEERDKLEWAALLHDLGKLEVPSEILNKNGRPTDLEWAILREHPGHGPAKAGELGEWLGEWIHAMDQHHERFDGTGYPLGLSAENIAMSGRIVAISDAFEVMTATRSYKKPMTTQAARDELVACAGSHFDPAIVRTFMAISIGDIHRALGPTSWLASIPYVGSVTQGIGATTTAAMLGGSISPALAATFALIMVTPSSAAEQSVTGEALAFADAQISVVDSAEEEPADPSNDDALTRIQLDQAGSRARGTAGHPGWTLTVTADFEPGSDSEPESGSEPIDDSEEDSPPILPPALDGNVGGVVEGVLETVDVLAGSVLGDTGLDDLVAPVVEETVAAVDDVTANLIEQAGLTEPVEGLGNLLPPPTTTAVPPVIPVQPTEPLIADAPNLGGLFGP